MADRYMIGAAVLIGGRSTRMGYPKEDIIIHEDGRTFLDRICDEVDDCFGEYLCRRYLSVRKGQKRTREGYTVVEDEYDDIGPIGGLVSVLKKASADGCDAVLLLACDMICYPGSEMIRICKRYTGQDILFARTEGKNIQPLASIYSVGILDTAIRQIRSGEYRLRRLGEYSDKVDYYDADFLTAYENVNTPLKNIKDRV